MIIGPPHEAPSARPGDGAQAAASFVRNAEGVREIRSYLEECHNKYAEKPEETPLPLIIAKVESTESLDK